MGEHNLWTVAANHARDIGFEKYTEVFRDRLFEAREAVVAGRKRAPWIWERVRRIPDRGKYPPRVFTKHSRFEQMRPGITFICRYAGRIDQGRILYQVRQWKPRHDVLKPKFVWGAPDTQGSMSYRPGMVLQAMVKLGLNLLVYIVGEDRVEPRHFGEAMKIVAARSDLGPDVRIGGFVANTCNPQCLRVFNAHCFELHHDYGRWCLLAALFGGRIGFAMTFPGPTFGNWRYAQITAPIRGETWRHSLSPILVPRPLRYEWNDMEAIIPDLPFSF